MSLILKALQKAQRKYANNARTVLNRNKKMDEGEAVEPLKVDSTQPIDPIPLSDEGESLRYSYTQFMVVLMLCLGGIFLLVSYHFSKQVQEISNIAAELRVQGQRIEQISHQVEKLQENGSAISQIVSDEMEKLNSELTAKIGNLKGEINNQKAVWDSAIQEQRKAVLENVTNVEAIKSENQDLKNQLKSVKDKVDTLSLPIQ